MTVPPGPFEASPHTITNALVRRQLSQFSGKTLGLNIRNAAGPADPDTLSVIVYLNTSGDDETEGEVIISGTYANSTITKLAVGTYTVPLSPNFTKLPGSVDVHWTYSVSGTSFSYVEYYEILEPMPLYDSLSESQQQQIEMVNWTMGDLFDSTVGGPAITEQFQTHYNYERLAQIEKIACMKINYMLTPVTHYIVGAGPGTAFPETYSDVLYLGTYIETIRHFIRSYVEQPNIQGSPGVSFTDRRDYVSRWKAVLDDELETFVNAVREFKRKNELRLGSTSMILAGGIFQSNRSYTSGGWAAGVYGSRFASTSFVLPVGGGSR